MGVIRSSTGSEREQWRLAMQAEVGSLRDSGSFETVAAADGFIGFCTDEGVDFTLFLGF